MKPESKSHVVYENLGTNFVNLWALLRSLSQRGFIGRVRVELKDYTADVFMTGSSTPLVREVDYAAGTETLEEGSLHRLVLRAREAGTISVFEGAEEAVAVRDAASGTGVPSVDHAQDARATTESCGTTAAHSNAGGTGVPPVDHAQDARATTESELPLSHSAPPTAAAAPMDQSGWDAMVMASGELIGGVERALTSFDADFDSIFRAARIELADDYTFLDPMSGGLVFENSTVKVQGELPPDSYVAGLSEALRRVVNQVATGERARRLRERVALELFSVARRRKQILNQSGFMAQLDRIAGTKVI